MAFASEFDRLRERMEQSRTAKEHPEKDSTIAGDSEDEQIFNSSIRQLWQQAVNVHNRNTESGSDETTSASVEEGISEESDKPSNEIESRQLVQNLSEAEAGDVFLGEDSTEEVVGQPIVEDLPVEELAAAIEAPVRSNIVSLQDHNVDTLPSSTGSFSPLLDTSEVDSFEEIEVIEAVEPIQSLAQISLDSLQREANDMMQLIYTHHYSQLGELFGLDIPEIETIDLTKTKLGVHLQHICDVATNQGKVTEESLQAVQLILPILWGAINDQSSRVPEDWYSTQLGFLFRYIKSGSSTPKFDPIDLSTAATILHMSEKELMNIYPKLGGVKLSAGYVFSRQRIEEYKAERNEISSPITIETLQGFYRNTKDCLTKLMRIHHFMSECSDEIRYVRDLLLSGSDFSHNRIKQPIKQLIEQRLAVLYKKYQDVNEFSFEQVEVCQNEMIDYMAPNVFEGLEQFSDSTMTGDLLAGMLESIIKLIDDERTKMNEITVSLTKNLGQLNIEIEMLKIKESL